MECELETQKQASDDKGHLQLRSKSPASAIGGQNSLISRSLGKMAALSLEDLQLKPGQEESYYDINYDNDEVLSKYPDPDRAVYDSKRYVHLE